MFLADDPIYLNIDFENDFIVKKSVSIGQLVRLAIIGSCE